MLEVMASSSALVVGASSSIGASIAERLRHGHDGLHLWGRDSVALADAAQRCRGGPPVRTTRIDVRDDAALRSGLHDIVAGGNLTTVVWVAGLFDWAAADEANPRVWHDVLDVNLTAASVFTAMVARHLVDSAPSALVYIGSGASHQAFANNAAYIASKHGLAGLAQAVFLDLRDRGVKVSLVSPGMVAAGGGLLSPAGQERPHELLQPADVADAVEYVVNSPPHVCPTEIRLSPQRS
jgi:NADP-dependent 3-hydroxy acid dehydrogenase YdfG